jgi:hypothetical protein
LNCGRGSNFLSSVSLKDEETFAVQRIVMTGNRARLSDRAEMALPRFLNTLEWQTRNEPNSATALIRRESSVDLFSPSAPEILIALEI